MNKQNGKQSCKLAERTITLVCVQAVDILKMKQFQLGTVVGRRQKYWQAPCHSPRVLFGPCQ